MNMQPQPPPAGWYDTGDGRLRWYDGFRWTDHYQVNPVASVQTMPAPQHRAGPMTAASLNVRRDVSYVRNQTGHSLIKHLLLGWLVGYLNVIYISVSPNHYWHA